MNKSNLYKNIALKLFTYTRGEVTQTSMDERLDLAKGTYHRLEAGYLIGRLSFFQEKHEELQFMEKWNYAMLKVLNVRIDGTSCNHLQQFISVWGEPSKYDLEGEFQFSKSKWWRLTNSRSEISLAEFFHIIEKLSGKLTIFLNILTDNYFDNYHFGSSDQYKNLTDLIKDEPEVCLITAALDLLKLKNLNEENSIRYISVKTKIPLPRLKQLIEELKQISNIGEGSGLLELCNQKVEIRGNEESLGNSVFQYILKLSKNQDVQNFKRKSYKIAAVSESTLNKIILEQRNSYERIQAIINDNNTEELSEILVLNQSLFSL